MVTARFKEPGQLQFTGIYWIWKVHYHPLVHKADYTVYACAIPMATIGSKWLRSRTTPHTSQLISPVLCSFFCSLLPLTFPSSPKPFLPYCVSTDIRCAVHDAYNSKSWSQELSAKKALCRSRVEGGIPTIIQGLCFFYGWQLYCDEPHSTQRPLCQRKSTSHPIVASGSPFEICPSPDATLCAGQSSRCVQTC